MFVFFFAALPFHFVHKFISLPNVLRLQSLQEEDVDRHTCGPPSYAQSVQGALDEEPRISETLDRPVATHDHHFEAAAFFNHLETKTNPPGGRDEGGWMSSAQLG